MNNEVQSNASMETANNVKDDSLMESEGKMSQKRRYHPPEEMIKNEADSGTTMVTSRAVKLPKLDPDERSEPGDEELGERNELKELVDRVKCEPPSEPSYINLEDEKLTFEEINVKCEVEELNNTVQMKREPSLEVSYINMKDEKFTIEESTVNSEVLNAEFDSTESQPVGIDKMSQKRRYHPPEEMIQNEADSGTTMVTSRAVKLPKLDPDERSEPGGEEIGERNELKELVDRVKCEPPSEPSYINLEDDKFTIEENNVKCEVEKLNNTVQMKTEPSLEASYIKMKYEKFTIEESNVKFEVVNTDFDSTESQPVEIESTPKYAAASTSATPFAEPPTIAAPKSSAQRQREYRQRIAASRNQAQSIAARISETDRKRNYRLRKAGSLESTTASSSRSAGRSNDIQNGAQRQLTNQQRQSLAAEPAQTTVQPGTSSDQIEVPDEPMDLPDLPLPSRSNAPIETQDAAASTSATPLAKPPAIAAPKSSAQRQREYRQRIAASKTTAQLIATRKSVVERNRNYRLRKAGDLALAIGSLESTTASSSCSADDDASASTSAMQFAKPPTIPGPKSSAQRQREYRQRIAASTPAQSIAARKSETERKRNYRQLIAALASGSLESTTASSSRAADDDAATSTSATPFDEPPTIAAPKSSAERKREYRQRIAAYRNPAQSIAARKSETERKRIYRLRKAALASGSLESTTASSSCSADDDASASTSAMQFAKPPTIPGPKSSAQRQREYRQRIAASTPAQSIAARKSETERKRNYRQLIAALASGSLESTIASSSRSAGSSNDVENGTQRQLTNQQRQSLAAEPAQTTAQPATSSDKIEVQQAQSTWNTKWKSSIMRFESTFLDNDFGYTCSVCDRLWFKNDLKPITAAQLRVISDWFIKENRQLCREEYKLVCNTCKRTLNNKSMPPLAKVNGFSYPERPLGLPPLDPISERLISPRLPFMQVRRLRHDFFYGITGQVINVPVDVQEMVKCLPRQLNEDDVINVNIERKLAHKSVYIRGSMSKRTIKAWLDVLQKSTLYRLYEINGDLSRLNPTVSLLDDIQDDPSNRIENISAENTPESEILASRQHTMMWNEEDCLRIAPGHQAKPLNNIIYDRHAEELSFPSIYFGEPRLVNKGVPVTHYMMATSEIRRRDRRGATPQKILYVAMKILRLRIVNGIHNTFRNVSVTENVTRRMLEDKEFLKEHVIQNFAFMKTVPNSVQYWASRKRDLFAMIRQLGKPTVFLSVSANEIHWMKLLTILLKLSNKYPGKTAKDLNSSQRCTLVSDDPVTCCIYFYKLVGSLMKMLKSKQSYNPFGNYSVKDYFLRIEFQHCGSPHAHILLWLNDDPHETVSENMPKTIELVEKLSSVARDDVPNDSIYANQIHKHTFTCTKRGETTCRFGIPYWPMSTTRVLVPMPQSDTCRQTLRQIAKKLRTSLGERRYACMDDFLEANSLTYASYLDIVRSTLRRPTLLFRRNFDELMTNTFNPYIAGEVDSNIEIQFILDEYSCAEYVVEYVNKSARGMSNLRRELTTMMQEHPERDYTGQLKALSIKLLNAVEMSAQEAAWYLLGQPMSETSRDVVYIPTVWPTERKRRRKRRQQMDREGIDGDSTNVWTKNIIQRYEERPTSLEKVYLAEFASWYANTNDFVDEADDVHVDDDEDSEGVPEARSLRAPKEYRRRLTGRIIRHRRYDIDETDNYKREMVLLYVQFRNEMSEIVDQNNFLQLFDENKNTIMERHSLFETNLNIENVMKELEALIILQNEDNSNLQKEESRTALGEDV